MSEQLAFDLPGHVGAARRKLLSQMRVVEEVKIEKRLSPRELQIMRLLAGGWTYGQMTTLFGCTTRTIITHVRRVRAKLNCQTNISAVFILTVKGYITEKSINEVINT